MIEEPGSEELALTRARQLRRAGVKERALA
jgi:hypothetical protein